MESLWPFCDHALQSVNYWKGRSSSSLLNSKALAKRCMDGRPITLAFISVPLRTTPSPRKPRLP